MRIIELLGRSLLGLSGLLLLSRPQIALAADNVLESKLETLEVKPGVAILWRLCPAINRPCGQETIFDKPFADRTPLKARKVSPKKILNDAVQRHAIYKWSVRDGVINVEPKERGGEDYLSRKLDKVSIKGASSLKAALDVLSQAEVPFSFQGPSRQERYATLNLELANVTVREALNAIVKMDGELMWSSTSSPERKWITFQMASWRKSGALFSNEELKSVKGLKHR